MTRDRVTGIITFVLGLTVAYGTAQIPKSMMAGDIGPRAVPYIAAALLIICGIGLIITGGKPSPSAFSAEELKRLGLGVLVVILYVAGVYLIGFIVPTAAALYALCTMFAKGKVETRWWQRVVFALVLTAVIYIAFDVILQLKLPTGKLF